MREETSSTIGKTAVLVAVAILGLLPIVRYWAVLGRVPTVSAAEAVDMLTRPGSNAVLIDVRTWDEFYADHLEGANSWPLDEILALPEDAELPPEPRGKTLILICSSGNRSAKATVKLSQYDVEAVYNVRGGLTAWTEVSRPPTPPEYRRHRLEGGRTVDAPRQDSSRLEQWAVSVSAFGVKPLYMLTSLLLIVALRRSTAPDLVALRVGLIAFLVGETFCAINYLFLGEDSYIVEYLHSLGMVLAFGFTTLAVIEAIDSRILGLTDPATRCAGHTLCAACVKQHDDVVCGARQLYLYLLPMIAIVALMLLCAPLHAISYNTTILDTPYTYAHPKVFQLFEVRYSPVVALLLFGGAFIALLRSKKQPTPLANLLFAYGMGFLGFGLFRFVIFGPYLDDLAWFIVWEEVLELLYVLCCAAVLWLFRGRLFGESNRSVTQQEEMASHP
jgi:rhodanese-related sulfurtransferase